MRHDRGERERSGVAVSVIRSVLNAVERAGGDVEGPLAAGHLTRPQLKQSGRRVAWADFIALSEALERSVVPIGGFEKVAPRLSQSWPELAALAGLFVSAETFYRFMLTLLGAAYPMVTYHSERLSGRREQLVLSVDEGEVDSSSFFRVAAQVLGGFATFVGHPPVVIDATIGPHEGVLEFDIPASATLLHRVTGAVQRLGIDYVEELQPPDDASRPFTERLTAKQRQVLELLLAGKSTEDLAQALPCTVLTARAHVAHLLRLAQVTTVEALVTRVRAEAPPE